VLRDLKPGSYQLRLYFAEILGVAKGERIQSVEVQGVNVAEDFDIAATTGELRGVVKEYSDVVIGENGIFELDLTAKRGQTLISGLELVRDGSSSSK
jgi:hypothetical protein